MRSIYDDVVVLYYQNRIPAVIEYFEGYHGVPKRDGEVVIDLDVYQTINKGIPLPAIYVIETSLPMFNLDLDYHYDKSAEGNAFGYLVKGFRTIDALHARNNVWYGLDSGDFVYSEEDDVDRHINMGKINDMSFESLSEEDQEKATKLKSMFSNCIAIASFQTNDRDMINGIIDAHNIDLSGVQKKKRWKKST